jgi:hypothetical protein
MRDASDASAVVIRKMKSVGGAGRGVGVVEGTGDALGDGVADGELKKGLKENREVDVLRVLLDASFGGGGT